MSDRILRALMQLFALVAKIDDVAKDEGDKINIKSSDGQNVIESFLKSELASSEVDKYINIFNERLSATRKVVVVKDIDKKRASLSSVKALKICAEINRELTHRQKVIVLIRMFEFVYSGPNPSEKEIDFIKTVADSFNIELGEYQLIKNFIEYDGSQLIDHDKLIYYLPTETDSEKAVIEVNKNLNGPLVFIYVESIGGLFVKYVGGDDLFINGKIVATDRIHLFSNGSTIRTTVTAQVYHSNLINKISKNRTVDPISYELKNVIHKFRNGNNAVHKINIAANGGNLIGIMGGSGTGKTSLLNIMNGNVKPDYGTILVNSKDLQAQSNELRGAIGNISQSDLLIEELTVFENLYYSAKLNLGKVPSRQITAKVGRILKQLGLYEIRHLKVGSALNKIISGGQRKRLNIAVELIREPSILFVDEPTSGLSSRDSEYIMELLKELSLSGKLIFVVIHQPSSHMFKMLDRLIIMDKGGYPVYDGIPVNAIVHFKKFFFKGNAHESECSLCGNVDPDQIFDLLESEVIDEYGHETGKRKSEPKDWYETYKRSKSPFPYKEVNNEIHSKYELPLKLKQFGAYLSRDFKSKISNRQYLIINGLVAPLLALILSFFTKYFVTNDGHSSYSYFENENIPQFIFISVIVAIFLGLTISAEEINKDKKILHREMFLKLSRGSYLLSKVLILFIISAVQAFLFVAISHMVLDIKGMGVQYWLLLFSTACVSNLTGLNISSAFNSAKVIYIIIPLLIIPQLLFSGVIVKFDKLHPSLSDATKVPIIGNIMVSRWAYEGIAVEQASQNNLEQQVFKFKVESSKASWKKDYWIPEIKRQMQILQFGTDKDKEIKELAQRLLTNEIKDEQTRWGNLACDNCQDEIDKLESNREPWARKNLTDFLNIIQVQCNKIINSNNAKIEEIKHKIGIDVYRQLNHNFQNESLNDLVRNSHEENKLVISNDRMFRNDDPIYHLPHDKSFFGSHFYAPYKYFGNFKVKTMYGNLAILWFISIITYIALYYDVLKKTIDFTQSIGKGAFKRKK